MDENGSWYKSYSLPLAISSQEQNNQQLELMTNSLVLWAAVAVKVNTVVSNPHTCLLLNCAD